MNKTAAIEWLSHSYHDLNGAILLYKASHFTDTISYVLHQSIEKSLKSLIAFNNQAIKKSHNLIELYELVCSDEFELEEEDVVKLSIATTYYTKQRYPTPHKRMPPSEEIKEIIDLADTILKKISKSLSISIDEIKAQ